jgi:hypothetical protein
MRSGGNLGVAHAVEPEKVVDMPDMTLDLDVLACWHHHSECFALDNYPAVDLVVMMLS